MNIEQAKQDKKLNALNFWGDIGILAIHWAQAFLSNADRLVLQLILESNQQIIDQKVFQEKAQQFLTVADIELSLKNLQEESLVKLQFHEIHKSQAHLPSQQRQPKVQAIQVNPNIMKELKQQLESKRKFFDHKQTQLLHMKDAKDQKQCQECKKLYRIQEIHLNDIKRCNDRRCLTGTLIPYRIDELFEQNLLKLQQILKTIGDRFEKSEYQARFPTQEDFLQQQQGQLQMYTLISQEVLIELEDKELQQFMQNERVKHLKGIFLKPIRKRIDEYINMRKKILNTQMIIE